MQEDTSILLQRLSHMARGVLDARFRPNLFGLTIDPSFERTERLAVSKTSKGLQWTYMFWDEHAEWDRILASKVEQQKLKFGKVKPTLQSAEGMLPDDYYCEEETNLKNLHLPIFIPQNLGSGFADGTNYTIAMDCNLHSTRFTWWEELPREWIALEPLCRKLMENMKIAREAAQHGAKPMEF